MPCPHMVCQPLTMSLLTQQVMDALTLKLTHQQPASLIQDQAHIVELCHE